MKRLIRKVLVTITVLMGVEFFVFLFVGLYDVSWGVLIGGSGSIVNLLSLWYDIERYKKVGLYKRGYLKRYVFNAVLFLLGSIFGVEGILGTFLGLLNFKVAAYIIGFMEGRG